MKIRSFGIVLVSLFVSHMAFAACDGVDKLRGFLTPQQVHQMYESCAKLSNDDDSQVILARRYALGTDGVKKDLQQALYYYQLSADNGNAESQAQLAKLYMELDRTPATRKLLSNYTKSIVAPDYISHGMNKRQFPEQRFKGELVHPYTLLLLASERAENKWYYPSKVRQAPGYVNSLLQSYPIDDAKKQKLMAEASAWKKRKLNMKLLSKHYIPLQVRQINFNEMQH